MQVSFVLFLHEQLQCSLFKRHLTNLDIFDSAIGHFCHCRTVSLDSQLHCEIEQVEPGLKGLPWKFDRSPLADQSWGAVICPEGRAGIFSTSLPFLACMWMLLQSTIIKSIWSKQWKSGVIASSVIGELNLSVLALYYVKTSEITQCW